MGFLSAYAGLAAFFAFTAAEQLERYPVELRTAVAIYGCLLLLLGMFLAPAFGATQTWLRERLRGPARAVACVVAFLLPYLIYCAGSNDFRWGPFLKLAAMAGLPLLLYAFAAVRDPRKLCWQDVLVLLWLALPVLMRQIHGIWNVPVNLDFMARLFIVSVGAWSFLIWRGVANAGYQAAYRAGVFRQSFVNFAGFAVIGMPLGFALDFVSWNPAWRGPGQFAFDFLTIFLFIAVPEELLFRGLLQNLLEGSWNSRRKAQVVASILFGFMHILHAPVPNWRYVILASIAGWFYGRAYRSTRSLLASGPTHALVDTVWRTWFERI